MKLVKNYTADDLIENYRTFISFVERAFDGERKDKLLFMYSENELGEELMMAPASGKLHFHSCYPGGYIDHVLNVLKNSIELTEQFQRNGGIVDFTNEELIFAAMHHDLGKLGDHTGPRYVQQESEWFQKNRNELYTLNGNIHFFDVTDGSIYLLNHYGIQFNQKEMLGIMLADGMYNEARKKYLVSFDEAYQLKTELPYIIHWADHMSCRIESSQYKNMNKKIN